MERIKQSKTKILSLIALGLMLCCASCSKFLDIVPDNTPQLDDAFASKNTSYNYLATCYHYLPNQTDLGQNPAFMGGDEIWGANMVIHYENIDAWKIAMGNQMSSNVMVNTWEGGASGIPVFRAVADCNTFLSYVTNMNKIPDLDLNTRTRWTGEVEFLKAYYNFLLFRQYGPIPLCDKNIPIDAPKEEMWIKRQSVDSCVNYMVGLLDDAVTKVPKIVSSPITEDGRINKAIVLAMKARILLYAASPLFNGNQDYADLANKDGQKLFPQTVDVAKWERAATAAKAAIDEAESDGVELYYYQNMTSVYMGPQTLTQMNCRMAVCDNYNKEVIWGMPNANGESLQAYCSGRLVNDDGTQTPQDWQNTNNIMDPTLRMAKLFYTKNGVPINEDKTLNFIKIEDPRVATNAEIVNFKPGYTSARLNFDREPRFYADMCFDGGRWLMTNNLYSDTTARYIQCKGGQFSGLGTMNASTGSVTGYFIKKLVHPASNFSRDNNSHVGYAWPEIRLADLYLMYAEALNESKDNQSERDKAYTYLDLIRKRAGLKGVVESWAQYSTSPSKPLTQIGLRSIIKQERGIEMAFEASRFWDLRRWKDALTTLNAPIQGWSVYQPDVQSYNRPAVVFQQKFVAPRDYLWPIGDPELRKNLNLVQNTGW